MREGGHPLIHVVSFGSYLLNGKKGLSSCHLPLDLGRQCNSDVHLKLGIFPCSLLCRGAAVIVEGLLVFGCVVVGSRYSGAGHPWNVREAAGGCAGQRGGTAFQEELPIVDNAGSSGCCAKQSPPRRSGVIMWHVGRIVDDHPSGGRNGTAGGLLTTHGHVQKL